MKTIATVCGCLLLVGCSSAGFGRRKSYGYVFHDSTGITTGILNNGKEIAILFSPDSNPMALKYLNALDWSVLSPNGDGKHIFIEGRLNRNVLTTSDHPQRAAPETYREFLLENWHMATPFLELVEIPGSLPPEFKPTLRDQLQLRDFKLGNDGENVDVSRFHRQNPFKEK